MPAHADRRHRLADHSADRRMLLLAVMALVVGIGATGGAWLLIRAIALMTNLFWFGRLSAAPTEIIDSALGFGTMFVPVLGSLFVGVMARFSPLAGKVQVGWVFRKQFSPDRRAAFSNHGKSGFRRGRRTARVAASGLRR